jgi:ubiquinone/menaquinone biosynthesis C-methylase UbiE
MTGQSVAGTDLSVIKARQKQTWSVGDIPVIARPLVGIAENICETVELRPGQQVLDVATGTGNVALAAARRYCEVTGIDCTAYVLEIARARAAVERLTITFLEEDAENLPFPAASFDAVLSTFGVMFSLNQEQAASEMLRVCRPGGKIGLASWCPDGFFGAMRNVMEVYAPPPLGLKSPGLWGSEERLRELFGDEIVSMQAKKHIFFHRYYSLQHALEVTCNAFGPAITALQALPSDARERMVEEIFAMFEQANQATNGTVVIPAEYLEMVAVRR